MQSVIPSRWRVVPFGNPRIKDYLHLHAAYRSLSRPSSPLWAKASAMRPFLLSRLAVISFTTLSSNSKNNRSYFQLYFFGFAFLQFVLCQYVKDLFDAFHEIAFDFHQVWRITDSNRWPPACKAGALASWANPPRKTAHSILLQLYWMLVVPGRLELPTSTLSVWRSNQLSYRTVKCRDYVSLLRGFILYKQNSAVQEAVGLLRPNLHILQCVFLSFF